MHGSIMDERTNFKAQVFLSIFLNDNAMWMLEKFSMNFGIIKSYNVGMQKLS